MQRKMKDIVYALKLENYLFAGEKPVREGVVSFITNNLFDTKYAGYLCISQQYATYKNDFVLTICEAC